MNILTVFTDPSLREANKLSKYECNLNQIMGLTKEELLWTLEELVAPFKYPGEKFSSSYRETVGKSIDAYVKTLDLKTCVVNASGKARTYLLCDADAFVLDYLKRRSSGRPELSSLLNKTSDQPERTVIRTSKPYEQFLGENNKLEKAGLLRDETGRWNFARPVKAAPDPEKDSPGELEF